MTLYPNHPALEKREMLRIDRIIEPAKRLSTTCGHILNESSMCEWPEDIGHWYQ